ncbi:acyl carrier protein [Streptomyces sp. NPDC052114]|uniref:acyl carrier protein n=1 Tax=unclassified Streptomyces TaxID=2593676 RepID=UPI003446AEB8
MLTLEDLRLILAECAGEDPQELSGEDISDRPFEELGYDSLVLLETSAQLKHRHGVDIPEDVVRELKTARAILEYANAPTGSSAATAD